MQKIDKIQDIIKLEGSINNSKRTIYFIFDSTKMLYNPDYLINGDKFITEQIKNVNGPLHLFTGIISRKLNEKNISKNTTPYHTPMAKMIFENITNENVIYHSESYPQYRDDFLDISQIINGEAPVNDTEMTKITKKIFSSEHIAKNYSHYIREIKIYVEKINSARAILSNFLHNGNYLEYDQIHSYWHILIYKTYALFRYLNFIRKINKDDKIQKIIIFGYGKEKILEELIKVHNFKITFSTTNPKEFYNTSYLFYDLINANQSFVELDNNFSLDF